MLKGPRPERSARLGAETRVPVTTPAPFFFKKKSIMKNTTYDEGFMMAVMKALEVTKGYSHYRDHIIVKDGDRNRRFFVSLTQAAGKFALSIIECVA